LYEALETHHSRPHHGPALALTIHTIQTERASISTGSLLILSTVDKDRISKQKPEKLADAIFESIHTSMHAIRSAQYQVLRESPYQLTHMEGKLLGFFARHPGSKLSDVVQHSRRDKGQLARLIKTLKEQGLLEASEDSQDRRSVCLQLSEEGKKVHESLRKQLSKVAQLAVSDLSQSEQEKLYELLEKLRVCSVER